MRKQYVGKSITIDIQGEHVSLKTLADALLNTNQILGEIDSEVSDTVTLCWDIGGLHFGSAQVTTVPVLQKQGYPDTGDEVVSLFKHGLELLESTEERPPKWTDKALRTVRELVSTVERSDGKLAFIVADGVRKDDPVAVTMRVVAAADALTNTGRTSYGAVEGTLEVLQGINDYFTILDGATGRRIRCECEPAVLDEIAARRLFRQRLVVNGEIREDRNGHPKSIKVQEYRPLRTTAELPQPEDLLGLYKAAT